MTDLDTTVARLRQLVEEFVARRDWQQFHTPKNLAMSMAIEAAELMEHFQWLTAEQSRAVAGDPARLAPIADELADVLAYLLAMANALGIDLSAALAAKMAKNERKYPAERFRGVFGPDDPNSPAS
jgi:NTP pyrophosphatase (non-canonical NTP hydrolase)